MAERRSDTGDDPRVDPVPALDVDGFDVVASHDASAASAAVEEFLSADPVGRNMPASFLPGAVEHAVPTRCWTASLRGAVCAAALQVPSDRPAVVVSDGPAAAEALGTAVGAEASSGAIAVPGARGDGPVVTPFAVAYAAASGEATRPTEAQRLYRLSALRPPEVPGIARIAADRDHHLVTEWGKGFLIDTGQPLGDLEFVLERRRAGLISVWEDAGAPVAMASATLPALGVARVGWVYTPPVHRGHGYGSAATAAACAATLSGGATDCVLYTQMTNPQSNRIYGRIGFVPVSVDLSFEFG